MPGRADCNEKLAIFAEKCRSRWLSRAVSGEYGRRGVYVVTRARITSHGSTPILSFVVRHQFANQTCVSKETYSDTFSLGCKSSDFSFILAVVDVLQARLADPDIRISRLTQTAPHTWALKLQFPVAVLDHGGTLGE
jgi:hypothetical protein